MYDETSLMAWIEKMKINRENAMQFDRTAVLAGMSLRRRVRYLSVFQMINKFLAKDIKEMQQEDVDSFFFFLRNHDYAEETRRCTWIIFRKICRHFLKLKFKKYKAFLTKKYKYPREILKRDDVLQMLQFCKTRREWLIVALLFNSGCRPDEFLHLKHTDITIDADGAILRVNGKTGERIIRLANIIDCKKELISYLSTIESSILFNFGIKYLSDVIKRIGWQSGLKQRMTIYLFRHSSATFLAQYLTESQMCAYFGWVQGSEMARIYVHLSARDIGPTIADVNKLLQSQPRNSLDIGNSLVNCKRINSVPVMAQRINHDDSKQLTLFTPRYIVPQYHMSLYTTHTIWYGMNPRQSGGDEELWQNGMETNTS